MKQVLQLPALGVAGLFRLYQVLVSPLTPASCRYFPCCSAYGITALRRHGLWRGLSLTVWRLMRCNPWSRGGVDHVPITWGQRPAVSGSIQIEKVSHGLV